MSGKSEEEILAIRQKAINEIYQIANKDDGVQVLLIGIYIGCHNPYKSLQWQMCYGFVMVGNIPRGVISNLSARYNMGWILCIHQCIRMESGCKQWEIVNL